jgi:hypothetical protein
VSKASDDRLKEIRDRKAMAAREWDEIYAEAKKDRLCVAGDPWAALDPQGKKQRLDPAVMRPCLASDELNQYLNQWINGIRANPRAIQFDPTGNGANDAGATFYQNHTREIEYRSHAQMAYCTAGADMATSSIGWLRLTAKRNISARSIRNSGLNRSSIPIRCSSIRTASGPTAGTPNSCSIPSRGRSTNSIGGFPKPSTRVFRASCAISPTAGSRATAGCSAI